MDDLLHTIIPAGALIRRASSEPCHGTSLPRLARHVVWQLSSYPPLLISGGASSVSSSYVCEKASSCITRDELPINALGLVLPPC